MTDESRINPKYRGMVNDTEHPAAENAVSDTQAELREADRGALWSLEVTERVYRTGGNQGHFEKS